MFAVIHGERHECARAEKGAKHVSLFDAAGDCIARFDGISDFAGYLVEGGEWTEVGPPAGGGDLEERVTTLEEQIGEIIPAQIEALGILGVTMDE